MSKDLIRQKISALLDSKKLGVLCTQGTSGPYANLVAIAASSDLSYICFSTPKDTQKYRNLTLQPRVALLVENSTNREDDFERAMALTVTGTATEPSGPEKSALTALLVARHRSLKAFINAPGNRLFKISVDEYVLVENFEQVSRLSLTD